MEFTSRLDTITISGPMIEVAAGFVFAFGFCARFASLIASGIMAVAQCSAYVTNYLISIANGGELGTLYWLIIFWISTYGSDVCSININRLNGVID